MGDESASAPLQGWELHGAAQRVQTQALGGERAIFGDAFLEEGAFITIPLDLVTSPFSIEFDVLVVDGSGGVTIGFTRLVIGCDVCVVLDWVRPSRVPSSPSSTTSPFTPCRSPPLGCYSAWESLGC